MLQSKEFQTAMLRSDITVTFFVVASCLCLRDGVYLAGLACVSCTNKPAADAPLIVCMVTHGAQEMVHSQQFYFWQHYRANRLKGGMDRSAEDPG